MAKRTNGLTPFTVEKFGGLRLDVDPTEAAAIDLLNVAFDKEGAVRSRDGYKTFASALTSSGGYPKAWLTTAGGSEATLLYGEGGTLSAYDGNGNLIDSVDVNVLDFIDVGISDGHYTEISTTDGFYYWDGGNFTDANLSQTTGLLAVTPDDNRVVTAVGSTVYFSDPGKPGTWGENNYVELHPNDGETITALTAWGDYVFAFKQTKFFVFYGTTADSDGNPVFNYRMVSTGAGTPITVAGLPPYRAAVAAPEGVYFIGDAGVFLTTGSAPKRISAAIDPWLRSKSTPFFPKPSPPLVWTYEPFVSIGYDNGRVLCVTTASMPTVFVYDIATAVWSTWTLPVYEFIPNNLGWHDFIDAEDSRRLFFTTGVSGKGIVGRLGPGITDDDGADIDARYRTGFYDMGVEAEKVVRETIIDGSGTVTLKTSVDYGDLDDGADIALGDSLSSGRDRTAHKGRTFSIELSGTAPWEVNRLTQHVRSQVAVGVGK